MWIASKLGFYSIVMDERDKGCFQVRSRCIKDMRNLQRAACLTGVGIMDTPKADYPFRMIVTQSQLNRITSTLALSADYTNFKNSLVDTDQADKLKMYHQWWADWQSWRPASEQPALPLA